MSGNREHSESKEHTIVLLFQGWHFGKYFSGRGESERKARACPLGDPVLMKAT